MSFRTVNDSTHTEDGWRCCNRDECDIPRIPDLFLVDTAPIRKGAPLTILGAWLFWYDRNVEEILTPVWGWSETNDVLGQPGKNNGSNHLSGTAVDVCAPKYPWGKKVMPPDKVAKVEEGRRLFRIGDQSGIFWGRAWSKPDEMHYQMAWREGDPRNDELAQKLRDGYLGIYKAWSGTPPGPTPTSYGLPRGTRINYGAPGFPDWVYRMAHTFGIRASTYAGHQETNRQEAGFAPNPQNLNRGIDWAGPVDAMQRYADYLLSIKGSLEQVIWQNPNTGQMVGVAGGKDVTHTGYYAGNYGGHRDHVHTRQSAPIPHPGGPQPSPTPSPPAASGLTAETLSEAMGATLPIDRYQALLPSVKDALRQCECGGNLNRLAMWDAQIGHESVGLKHFTEIGNDAYFSKYDGRMGNGPGEGAKYRGRGAIQVTGKNNYRALSRWAHEQGLTPSPTHFLDHPEELATDRYAFTGAVWYWLRNNLNVWADRGDIEAASRVINTGNPDPNSRRANGIDDRIKRWNRCLAMGLPKLDITPTSGEDDLSAEAERKIAELHEAFFGAPDFASLSPLHKPGEGKIGNLTEFMRWMDANVHIMTEIMLVKLRWADPQAVALLESVAADPDPQRNPYDRRLAKAILAEMDEPKTSPQTQTVSAQPPAPVVVHHYEEPEPEVLPAAVIHAATAPQSAQYTMDTPKAMLETMHAQASFHEAYMDARRELIAPNRNEETEST